MSEGNSSPRVQSQNPSARTSKKAQFLLTSLLVFWIGFEVISTIFGLIQDGPPSISDISYFFEQNVFWRSPAFNRIVFVLGIVIPALASALVYWLDRDHSRVMLVISIHATSLLLLISSVFYFMNPDRGGGADISQNFAVVYHEELVPDAVRFETVIRQVLKSSQLGQYQNDVRCEMFFWPIEKDKGDAHFVHITNENVKAHRVRYLFVLADISSSSLQAIFDQNLHRTLIFQTVPNRGSMKPENVPWVALYIDPEVEADAIAKELSPKVRELLIVHSFEYDLTDYQKRFLAALKHNASATSVRSDFTVKEMAFREIKEAIEDNRQEQAAVVILDASDTALRAGLLAAQGKISVFAPSTVMDRSHSLLTKSNPRWATPLPWKVARADMEIPDKLGALNLVKLAVELTAVLDTATHGPQARPPVRRLKDRVLEISTKRMVEEITRASSEAPHTVFGSFHLAKYEVPHLRISNLELWKIGVIAGGDK